MYHGSRLDQPPSGPGWLAFEIEHSETFAISRKWTPGECRRLHAGIRSAISAAHQPSAEYGPGDCSDWNSRGYFHTDRAYRDINLLYIDGMGAAKSRLGTLDSQNLVLRENRTGSWDVYIDEAGRANSICDMITEWGFDGFVRMEIGFEVVHCDFNKGMELITVTRSLLLENQLGSDELQLYQLARAIRHQFDGLQADRLASTFQQWSRVSSFQSTSPALIPVDPT